MILKAHLPYFTEIFELPNFLSTPALLFGVQDIEAGVYFSGKRYAEVSHLLLSRGVRVSTLDLFDPRASLRYDMNFPVPEEEHGAYKTVIDIGSIEHVFDTRQCLENCLRMVALGGHYLLHTPVNGYYAHGLHVFNPSALIGAVELNGFRVIYRKYSREDGTPVSDPAEGGDILIWLVAVRERESEVFRCPQQDGWSVVYPQSPPPPARFEMRYLPRAKVSISLYVPHGYPLGKYRYRLVDPAGVTISEQGVQATLSEGITTLMLKLDLSNREEGAYMLGIKTDEVDWTYQKFSLLSEVPVRWLKL